jgi:acetolactate synthase-1/3 small subunit
MTKPTALPVQHTFTAYLEDRPGALSRVSALFLRRSYNIVSLTVGRSATPGVSRLTVVVETDAASARLVEANLYKLVNVLRVEDVTYAPSLSRELTLVKMASSAHGEIAKACMAAGARIVDETPGAIVVESVGSQRDNEQLIESLRRFSISEVVRTGVAAMKRGPEVLGEQPQFINATVPATEHDMRLIQ